MTFIDFYNQNRFQSSPFETSVVYLSLDRPEWFVDCGVILRHSAYWKYTNSATLHSVTSHTGYCSMVIRCIGVKPDLSTVTTDFTFDFSSSDAQGTTLWVDDDSGQQRGRAFLTIGQLPSVLFSMGVNLTPGASIRKPKIHTFYKKEITSVSVANQYSTLYADSQCFTVTDPSEEFKIEAVSLNGDLRFTAGRHSTVLVLPAENAIAISTSDVASVMGDIPCESPRTLPSGYNTNNEQLCSDLLFTINGVGAQEGSNVFLLEGSAGVFVEDIVGSPNAIRITFDSQTLFGAPDGSNNCDQTPPYSTSSYNCVY